MHGVILSTGVIGSGGLKFRLESEDLRELLIPKFCSDTTKEVSFILTSPHIVEATQEFFGAKSTKFVQKIPSTGVDHFVLFTYGITAQKDRIQFRAPALADDFSTNFKYEFPRYEIIREANTFIFPVITKTNIAYDAEDYLNES